MDGKTIAVSVLGIITIFIVPVIIKKFKIKDKPNINLVSGVGSAWFKSWILIIGIFIGIILLFGWILEFFY